MKIKTTTDLKINQSQENIDLTKAILDKKVIEKIVSKHGALWFLLYEIFVPAKAKTFEEFKANFFKDMFTCLFLIAVIYVFRLLLGGQN